MKSKGDQGEINDNLSLSRRAAPALRLGLAFGEKS